LVRLLLKLVKKFPYFTVTLVAASYAFYFLVGRYENSWIWGWETQVLIVRLVFSPTLHGDWFHLFGDTVFLIAGTLVESWMILSRRIRYGILLACYLISVEVSYLGWAALTPTHRPPVGLSGMIAAALGFALAYCVVFRKHIRFGGWNLLPVASIVLLLAIEVWNALGVMAGLYSPLYVYPLLYHAFALLQATGLGLVLFLLPHRLRQDAEPRRNRDRT
jgi:hypothetical protein